MNETFDTFIESIEGVFGIFEKWMNSLPPSAQIIVLLLLLGGTIFFARHLDRKKQLREFSKKQSEEKIKAQNANAHYRAIQIDNEDNHLYLAIGNDGKYTLSKRPFEANRFDTHEDASVAAVSFRAPETKIRIEKIGTCTKCADLTVLDPISEWRANMQETANQFDKIDWSLCDTCAKKQLGDANKSLGVKLMWWWFLAIALGLIGASLSG